MSEEEYGIKSAADKIILLEAEIERLKQENASHVIMAEQRKGEFVSLMVKYERLRAALQRIKDNGERGGYAYGVAFAALQNKMAERS